MTPHLSRQLSAASAGGWNPWPAGVAGFLVFFFGATIGLVVIAVRQPADLVSKNYYEQEIRFQSRIDQVNRSRSLPGRLAVAYEPASGGLRISLPGIPPGEKASGEIRLYRPSDPRLDRSWPLSLDASGAQTAPAPALAPGLWRVEIDWTTSLGAYSDARDFNAPRRP